MSDITLESLIQEQKDRIKTIRFNRTEFFPYYDYNNKSI